MTYDEATKELDALLQHKEVVMTPEPSRFWNSVLVGACIAMVVLAALGVFR